MFRPFKCSSSGRLVHVIFMAFLSYIKHILPAIRVLIWMPERNTIKPACTSLPDDKHFNGRNMSKTQYFLIYTLMQNCALWWFLSHWYITMRNSEIVNLYMSPKMKRNGNFSNFFRPFLRGFPGKQLKKHYFLFKCLHGYRNTCVVGNVRSASYGLSKPAVISLSTRPFKNVDGKR